MKLLEALADAERNAETQRRPYVVLMSDDDYSCLSLRAWRRFGWVLGHYSPLYLIRVDVTESGPITTVAHHTYGTECTWSGVTA